MLLRVDDLPEGPLEAAARFYDAVMPALRDPSHVDEDAVLVFPPADHTHRGWRLAAVQELAREHAPRRVNAVASADRAAIAAAAEYLASAYGVTGQLLELDGNGAGEVLSPSP